MMSRTIFLQTCWHVVKLSIVKRRKPLTVAENTRLAGQARMNGMSKEERKQLAKKAAAARWNPQSANAVNPQTSETAEKSANTKTHA